MQTPPSYPPHEALFGPYSGEQCVYLVFYGNRSTPPVGLFAADLLAAFRESLLLSTPTFADLQPSLPLHTDSEVRCKVTGDSTSDSVRQLLCDPSWDVVLTTLRTLPPEVRGIKLRDSCGLRPDLPDHHWALALWWRSSADAGTRKNLGCGVEHEDEWTAVFSFRIPGFRGDSLAVSDEEVLTVLDRYRMSQTFDMQITRLVQKMVEHLEPRCGYVTSYPNYSTAGIEGFLPDWQGRLEPEFVRSEAIWWSHRTDRGMTIPGIHWCNYFGPKLAHAINLNGTFWSRYHAWRSDWGTYTPPDPKQLPSGGFVIQLTPHVVDTDSIDGAWTDSIGPDRSFAVHLYRLLCEMQIVI